MQVKGGKCMIINDNGREYDTEKIEEYSSYTQGLIKRLIDVRYVGIRDLLSDNCCSKYKVNQVREACYEGSYSKYRYKQQTSL